MSYTSITDAILRDGRGKKEGRRMNRFYVTPSIFWETNDKGEGKFTIAWLSFYFDVEYHIK